MPHARPADQDIPDNILPEQYFNRSRINTPIKRLLFAVLEDAVTVATTPVKVREVPTQVSGLAGARLSDERWKVRRYNEERTSLLDETLAWFASTDSTDIMCFESICDVLGFDASYIRRGVLACKKPVASIRFRMSGGIPTIGSPKRYYYAQDRRRNRKKKPEEAPFVPKVNIG